MGGLFSSTRDTQEPTTTYIPPYSTGHNTQRTDSFVSHTYRVPTAERQRPVIRSAPVQQITAIPCVPSNRSWSIIILQQNLTSGWSTMPSYKEYMLVPVPHGSSEYIEVQRKFRLKIPKQFKVTKIERVQNPYLLGCYLLKKHEMQVLYGNVNEMLAFHGTKMCNVEKICTNNFDWRLHGESVGNRFGKGVSFSPKSSYASNYSDKNREEKVMFLVRILYHKIVQGNGSMELPPLIGYGDERYDTSAKQNQDVVVKFCDNEFYPQYLIYYTGSFYKRKSQNRENISSWEYDSFY